MSPTSQIDASQRNGNLHVKVVGYFSPELAEQLTETIHQSYQGKGNIFIHTDQLTGIAPESKEALALHVDRRGLPHANLYLTGTKGFEISPAKCRVIVYDKKKHACCGKCRNCSCNKDV